MVRSVHPAVVFAGLVDQAAKFLSIHAPVRINMSEDDCRQELFLSVCERMPRTQGEALEALRLCRNRIRREMYAIRKERRVDPMTMEQFSK